MSRTRWPREKAAFRWVLARVRVAAAGTWRSAGALKQSLRSAGRRTARNERVKWMVLLPLRPFGLLWNRVASVWPGSRRRVLLLEDDTSMQRLVAKLLRRRGVRVEVFGDGRSVVARVATAGGRYAALLLDLMMPHEGGLTVLRDLRDHDPSLLGRVILLTASGSGVTDPWSPRVFAVVHKPFSSAELVTTVRACMKQPGSRWTGSARNHGRSRNQIHRTNDRRTQ